MPETPLTNRPKMHTGVPSSLTSAHRSVMRAVAVADAPCGLWFLEAVAAHTGTTSDERIDATVEELIVRGFLVDTAAGLRLSSIALRDDVLRDTPPSVRQALREAAAEALADAGRPAQAARQLLRVLPAVSRSASALAARLAVDPAVGPSLAADLLLAAPAPGAAEARLAWLVDVADNLYWRAGWTRRCGCCTGRSPPTGTGHASGRCCSGGSAPTTRPSVPRCP
ncbi:hypothetical protein [Micromonospora chalcea]|uniref:hypothetical protein n=1 Tax=Micromonospora chalcea TaxID=1874 RepID=UPI0033D7500A